MKPVNFTSIRGKTVIGLTGPIASGKSLALKYFIGAGAFGVSADTVTSELLTTPRIYHTISRKFSPDKIQTKGLLDKKKLAAEIFASPAKRKWLESLLHPEILRRIHSLIKESDKKLAVVEAPVLFEAGLAECFTFTVCLSAPAKTLEARALKRGWSRRQYLERVKAQLPAEEKCARADLTLDNSGGPAALAAKIRFICRFLKETAQGKKK
ncbi:MAG: dephospho-CoA kinase [Elusimicrobia bacterium GWC2_64_44]|nr:MAG: dephospho-CoA kinase [Elusimicrobia bacterium GWC2_64_44]